MAGVRMSEARLDVEPYIGLRGCRWRAAGRILPCCPLAYAASANPSSDGPFCAQLKLCVLWRLAHKVDVGIARQNTAAHLDTWNTECEALQVK